MPDVQMSYADVEATANQLRQGANRMQDTLSTIRVLIGLLHDGALLGDAGNLLVEALESKLVGKLGQGADRLSALAADLEGAMADLQSADKYA